MSTIQKYLLLFLFSFPTLIFFVDLTRNPFFIQGVMVYVTISLLFILFLINALRTNHISLHTPSSVEIAVLAFWIFCVASWLFGFVQFPQYKIAVFSEGARAFLLLTFNGLLTMYLPILFIKDEALLDSVFRALFVTATLAATYGILQFFGMEIIWPRELNAFNNRCVSTFGNPNFLSSYLVMLLPLAMQRILYSKDAFYKVVWLGVTATFLTALVCTATRSSWLGFGIALILFVFFYARIKNATKSVIKIVAVVCVLSAGIIYCSPAKTLVFDRLKRGFEFNKKNPAVYQRVLIWSSAYDIFKEHPVTGAGWGLFEMLYPQHQGKYLKNPDFAGYRTHANNTHNEILELVTQVGLVGLGLFIWIIVCFWKWITRIVYSKTLPEKKRVELAAILASIMGMLVDNLLNVSLHFTIPMMIFWFLIGVSVKNVRWITNDETRTREYPVPVWIKPLFVLFMVFLVGVSVIQIRFFMAEKHYFRGMSLQRAQGRDHAAEVLLARNHFEKTRKLHRYEVNNLYDLGNAYAQLRALDQATEIYREAIASNPGYDEIHFNLGAVYTQQKKFKDAVHCFETSFAINPCSVQTLYALSTIYLSELKDYRKAIDVLEKAIQLDPTKATVFNNLGCLYSEVSEWDNAIAAYKKALTINPHLAIAQYNLESAKKKQRGMAVQFAFDMKPV